VKARQVARRGLGRRRSTVGLDARDTIPSVSAVSRIRRFPQRRSARPPSGFPLAARALATLALAAAPALAWSPTTQETIAHEAARLAPPDLARQLLRHAADLTAGATEPFHEADAARHYRNEDGSGSVDATLDAEVAQAVAAIRAHRPFTEVARRLGRVSHWASDLDNPLNASSADREEPRYFRDFLDYVDSARPRFAVVVYEWQPPLATAADVETLARDALARGRRLYPFIGLEYRRIGFGSGRALFDDRSTAFGLAALAYSHAVTDAARLFRYVWLAAGGTDPRPVFARPRDRVLVLDQGGVP
jgi:hypothetical protein